jgi:hypothetical protein
MHIILFFIISYIISVVITFIIMHFKKTNKNIDATSNNIQYKCPLD